MPFDSNGVFSRVMNWTSDQQNGIAIECGRHDDEDDNFAQGFNDCFCRDGRAPATGNFNLGGYKIQNLANAVATTDAVNKGQMDTALNAKANTSAVVSLTGTQSISGTKTFLAKTNMAPIELYPVSSGGPYIDFHYNNSTSDYTSRIIEQASGDLVVTANNFTINANGYARASDTNGSIVTTVNKSKSANGYFKLGNGLIVQWGTVSNTGGTVTLPTPFSNANYGVTFTRSTASGTNDNDAITARRATSFDVTIYQGGGGTWMAIGY